MLPGGGIGPELMAHVREVFNAIGAPVDFEIIDIHPMSEGNDDLDYAIMSIKRNGVAIKGKYSPVLFYSMALSLCYNNAFTIIFVGNIETKSEETEIVSRNVALRNELDLFVNVVECKSYENVHARQKNINIAIVRQNTEGEYAMLEHEVYTIFNPNSVEHNFSVLNTSSSYLYRVFRASLKAWKWSQRKIPNVLPAMPSNMVRIICRTRRPINTWTNYYLMLQLSSFTARSTGRTKVTTIHKANIMKISDGLFLETSRRVSKEYPDIQHNDMIIDNCCMQLVSNPHQFQVMNMTNLYGTIVSNVICGISGGAGLLSGKNYGDHVSDMSNMIICMHLVVDVNEWC